MKTQMRLLKEFKKITELDNDYYLEVVNKETNWEGEAYFTTNQENMIKVYEGSPDGRDDHEETFENFIKKYDFRIKRDY